MSKNLPPLKYILIAVLTASTTTFFIIETVRLVGWNIEWARLGLTIFSFFIALDLLALLKPTTFKGLRIFNNIRNTLIIILGLLNVTLITYWPEFTGNTAWYYQTLAAILGIASTGTIFYVFMNRHKQK